VNALSNGNHTISIHAKDAVGNWGPFTTATLTIDRTPPTVGIPTLTPSASNNTAVAISATANDTATGNSNIGGGEYFIDTAGAAGTGAAMTATAALPNTTITANIPAATIGALTTGNHTIYVRAKDAAGNWSTTTSATLLIDRTAPTFTGISISPNSISVGTPSVTLTVNGASDAGGSGVAGGEYWFGSTDITAGTGTAFTGTSGISVATGSLTPGTYTLRVRIRDGAGNWSTGTGGVRTTTLTVTVVGPAIPSLTTLDSFTRANANNLGSNWNQASTGTDVDLRVNSNQVFANQTEDGGQAIWNVSMFGAKQAAAFTFANTTLNNSALILKATGASITSPTNFIRVRYEQGSTRVRVAITTNGGSTYATGGDINGITFASGDTMTAMVDSTGMVYVWKTSGATTTLLGNVQLPNNALWTTGSGRIGIKLQSTGARVDNFGGGTVP
jgi:hypothetical protein